MQTFTFWAPRNNKNIQHMHEITCLSFFKQKISLFPREFCLEFTWFIFRIQTFLHRFKQCDTQPFFIFDDNRKYIASAF